MLNHFNRVWHFATPWTITYQVPLSMGFSRQEYWSGLPVPSTGDLPNPGIKPRSPTLQADSLPCASPAAKLSCFKSCLTLCNPIDGSLPGSPVPGILQARTLEWVAISFSNAWKWKVKVKSLQSCLTLRHPMDCSLPGSSVHGILQARIRSGLSVPSTGDLPNPGIKPRSPTLQADSLPSASPGKTAIIIFSLQMIIQAQRIKV